MHSALVNVELNLERNVCCLFWVKINMDIHCFQLIYSITIIDVYTDILILHLNMLELYIGNELMFMSFQFYQLLVHTSI